MKKGLWSLRELAGKRRAEWVFGVVVFGLCASLSFLQYRWTGAIARAEKTRLLAGLDEQTEAFASAFDRELWEARQWLWLEPWSPLEMSLEESLEEGFTRWRASGARPVFGRVGLSLREGSGSALRLLNFATGKLEPANHWPPGWERFAGRPTPGGEAPGPRDPNLWEWNRYLLEMPLSGGDSGRTRERFGGPEAWLLLELDAAYLREQWWPQLFASFLQSENGARTHFRIVSMDGAHVYCASGPNQPPLGTPVASARLLGDQGTYSIVPGPGRWVVEAWRAPRELEALVQSSRRRNLCVALLLNGLLFFAFLALMRFTRRSRQLAERQMQFVATVSHELRTPLTVVRGAAHNLERGLVRNPERVADYAGLILQNVNRLSGMVEQTLAIAGAHRPTFEQSCLDLREVVDVAVSSVIESCPSAAGRFRWISPSEPVEILGDREALRRVFDNLITNALKHGPAESPITLAVVPVKVRGKSWIEAQVADAGGILREAEYDRVFQPFVRGVEAESQQTPGSGLGLAVVKEVVEAHGGTVGVRTESGKGTVFFVRLPRVSAEEGVP